MVKWTERHPPRASPTVVHSNTRTLFTQNVDGQLGATLSWLPVMLALIVTLPVTTSPWEWADYGHCLLTNRNKQRYEMLLSSPVCKTVLSSVTVDTCPGEPGRCLWRMLHPRGSGCLVTKNRPQPRASCWGLVLTIPPPCGWARPWTLRPQPHSSVRRVLLLWTSSGVSWHHAGVPMSLPVD